jgi:hypothetical protein
MLLERQSVDICTVYVLGFRESGKLVTVHFVLLPSRHCKQHANALLAWLTACSLPHIAHSSG